MKSKQVVLKLISKNGLELMVCKNRLHTLFKKDFKSQKNVNFQNCEFEIIYEIANYHQHFYPLQKVHFSVLPLSNGTFFIFTPCKWDIFLFLPLLNGTFFISTPFQWDNFQNEKFLEYFSIFAKKAEFCQKFAILESHTFWTFQPFLKQCVTDFCIP